MESQNRSTQICLGESRRGAQDGFLREVMPSLSLGGVGHGEGWYKTFLQDVSPRSRKCLLVEPLLGSPSPTNEVREAGSTGWPLPSIPAAHAHKVSEAGRGKLVSCREAESTVRKGALN